MGDGAGLLPDHIEGDKIANDLTVMFTANRAATIQKVKDIKSHTFPYLLEYPDLNANPPIRGAARRQRTLRHAAWLLTADNFDSAQPSELFRKWLRYLTWIGLDAWHPSSLVIVDNVIVYSASVKTETPSQAILKTLKKSIDNDQPIEFKWGPADSPPALKVDIVRASASMRIIVTSKREVELPQGIASSDEDAFSF